MKSKFTSFKWLMSLLIPMLISSSAAHAQTYCFPTFANGCFSWSNQAINLDSINWILDGYYCEISDYTSMSTTLNAGSSYAMDVMNGDWCGSGVWIDFNQDFDFDTTENLFHLYQASETNNYSFTIAIPDSIPTGTYRMRVVAGWGSDCYNVSANGYGACGSYQYGNFDDFTVNIIGMSTGSQPEISNATGINIYPNPVSSTINVSIQNGQEGGMLQLSNLAGQALQTIMVNEEIEVLDMGALPKGLYFLQYHDGNKLWNQKLVKE